MNIYILFTFILLINVVSASSGTCGNDCHWELTNGVLTITGSGPMDDYSWDSLAPWYSEKSSITQVEISGATSIGNYSFYECASLTTITITDSITSIGQFTFYGCWKLASITIPESVTSIEEWTFGSCASLKTITFPE